MMKIYKNWGLTLVLLLMMTSTQLLAQALQVSGKITDETGQPIPGANILEKGTANGTVTDGSGAFSLNVSGGSSAVLVISFIGYKSQEVTVGDRTVIDLSLAPDITSLQEVVVTGYTS